MVGERSVRFSLVNLNEIWLIFFQQKNFPLHFVCALKRICLKFDQLALYLVRFTYLIRLVVEQWESVNVSFLSLSSLYVTVLDFECNSSFIYSIAIVLTYCFKKTNLLILELKKWYPAITMGVSKSQFFPVCLHYK